MRILIGYNGTEASMAAIQDLQRAGLPAKAEAVIVTVAESWDHPADEGAALKAAADATEMLRETFPGWRIGTETATGSPASEILAIADRLEPDLIVVGEPAAKIGERGSFLGQTSHKLLTDAGCSVRISREPVKKNNGSPLKLTVGFDGSRTSITAIDTILSRDWPDLTEVKLVAVADSNVLQMIGRFTPQMMDSVVEEKLVQQWADSLAAPWLQRLDSAGLDASVKVRFGNPKLVLTDEAHAWGADAIFVGPHSSPNSFARFLIGSVSATVAARADCSVEVVRERHDEAGLK